MTAEEILAVLEEPDSEDDLGELEHVFIEPPEPHMESDEDSADEDSGGRIDNLSARQLRSGATAVFRNGKRLGCQSNSEEPIDNASSRNDKQSKNIHWEKEDPSLCSDIFPDANHSWFRGKNPHEIFEKFFDGKVISLLVDEIRKYAVFKNEPDPLVSEKEVKVFLAILILSGNVVLPTQRSYWENDTDMRNLLVYESMRRDRFLLIKRFLHFADSSSLSREDKMWKLRPLLDHLRQQFMKFYQPSQQLSFDESMIEYFGHHGCKQFLKDKPIRFGYKVWSLNAPNGYLVNFEIYQGKSVRSNNIYESEVGICSAPLARFIDELPEQVKALPHRFYFDNLFPSYKLLNHLSSKGYRGTGTIRENRLGKTCPLPPVKVSKKKERGTIEYIKNKDDGIILTRWTDGNAITIASNVHGVGPISNVQRYSRVEKKIITVKRPNAVAEYNKYMGGTDQMDKNVNGRRIGIRGKKWWWPIFTWSIDVAIQNSWLLYRKANAPIPLLDFRRQIVRHYLTRY